MKISIPSFFRRLPLILLMLLLTGFLNHSIDAVTFAGEFHNSLSLQGFTGLLNTPNAEVADEGAMYALYSNQQEKMWRGKENRQDNYMFSVGFFSFAEVGGRVTDAPVKPHNIMDLSANFKVKVPFIPKGYYLPSIAFGMQDIGGGSTQLKTTYVVASEELWRFRLSLGYGNGPNRMKGVFGGAEFKAFDWLYLVGENDTKETNAGIRLISPSVFGIPVHLNVTAKTSLSYRPGEVIEFGFGLQFPLGLEHNNKKPLDDKTRVTYRAPEEKYGVTAEKEIIPDRPEEALPKVDDAERDKLLMQLKKTLICDGFQNVEVGSTDKLVVIEYENGRYNHNELDGLGVVAGITSAHVPPGTETIRFVIRKKGIRVLQLTTPAEVLRDFLLNADKLDQFDESLKITADVTEDKDIKYVGGDSNASWLTSSVVFEPGLTTFVATEVGTFDYLLSARPSIYLNLWKGSILQARWDIPVSWSENFDDGKLFRDKRDNPQFDRFMAFQAFRLLPTVMASLGAGMVLHNVYGTLDEIMWIPGDGTHRFQAKFGYAENNNHDSDSKNKNTSEKVILGLYRFYFDPLETYLEVAGGRFWSQDTGFTVELKRFFGDTSFSVYYKNSRTFDGQHVQMGGVQFSFPLTPRRDMKPYFIQLRGSDEWTYSQETEIVNHSTPNLVGVSVGINPQPPFNLERVFYNRDRFMESYIRKHLLRLRDANIKYNENRFP